METELSETVRPPAPDLLKGLRDGLRPEPPISVTEWADKNIILPDASAEPGPYRSSKTPYLRKIMECLSPHNRVRKVVFMKSSQVGGTQVGLNWIGSIIATAPGGILMVSPTDKNAKKNSKIRIDPMIKSTPALRDRVKSAKIREGGNTVLQKDFTGGFLVMIGANSPADLKSLPCRYTIYDEIDEYPEDLDEQGDILELGDARSITFFNSKSYVNSTPTTEDRSKITKEFEDTDQQYYYVPCPHCGTVQKLEFENLVYDTKLPAHKLTEVFYKCGHCPEVIDERYKSLMLENGDWVAECPEKTDPEKMGFHINALYSPWFPWLKIIKKYLKALNNEPKMRTFNNTILGKPHKQAGEQPDYNIVYNKRVNTYLPNRPPVEVCFITAGADVQKDRIEVEIVGWAKGKRSYSLDYRVFIGDTTQLKVYDEVAKLVNETWERSDGVLLPLRMMCIDTGHNQSYVYDFCRRFDISRVVPIKGGNPNQGVIIAQPTLIDYTRDGKKVGSIRSWNVGVSILKSELYGWLKLNKTDDGYYPPGYCFFPMEGHYSGHDYFKGLCAEQLEYKKNKSGTFKYTWVKKYPFNEPLDCRNYARAAASILQIDRFEDKHYDALLRQSMVKKPVKKIPKDKNDEWI
jgi:phage terminase large subunit GpA-like protein